MMKQAAQMKRLYLTNILLLSLFSSKLLTEEKKTPHEQKKQVYDCIWLSDSSEKVTAEVFICSSLIALVAPVSNGSFCIRNRAIQKMPMRG